MKMPSFCAIQPKGRPKANTPRTERAALQAELSHERQHRQSVHQESSLLMKEARGMQADVLPPLATILNMPKTSKRNQNIQTIIQKSSKKHPKRRSSIGCILSGPTLATPLQAARTRCSSCVIIFGRLERSQGAPWQSRRIWKKSSRWTGRRPEESSDGAV